MSLGMALLSLGRSMGMGHELSPRLETLVRHHGDDELRSKLIEHQVFSVSDLGNLAMDAEAAATSLEIAPDRKGLFEAIFATAQAAVDSAYEKKMYSPLDVLDGGGAFIMSRPRYIVHRDGFWHRAVNVWVLCIDTGRVLLGQRASTKDIDPNKWTCICGRVPSGDFSFNAAMEQLSSEVGLKGLELDADVSLAFSMKSMRTITQGVFNGQSDATWLDVYVATLATEVPLERLHLDVADKQDVKYITIDQLRDAYDRKDPDFVLPANHEYLAKLFRYLTKAMVDANKS